MSTEPDAPPSRPSPPGALARSALSSFLWMLGMAGAGLLICGVYLHASPLFPDCDTPYDTFLGGTYEGGAAAGGSLRTAALIGIALWAAASISTRWLRRWLPLVVVGFILAYIAALIVLWNVSPMIWGPRVCV
ncbi:MAG TPA: hypothetical protein VLU96_09855 [Gaiellaceae bacterium]|nr:hypothetical protein [Gaiellaceae bacterium]